MNDELTDAMINKMLKDIKAKVEYEDNCILRSLENVNSSCKPEKQPSP